MYGYLLYNNDEIVYVGLTQNIESRVSSHKRTGKNFDKVIVESFECNTLAVNWEKKYISEYNPIYNISPGGYCRKDSFKRKRLTTSLTEKNHTNLKLIAIKLNIRPCDVLDLALLDFYKKSENIL